jgi:site-specific recombinase XerD
MGPLSADDLDAIEKWQLARLAGGGESGKAVQREIQRVRSFAGHSPRGLLRATRSDFFAFSQAWARRRGVPLAQLTGSRTWRLTYRALRDFFGWASTKGLVDATRYPMRGIRVPPSRTSATMAIGPKDGPLFEAVLSNPRLRRRERAMLLLLAHGLSAKDVVCGRIEDLDLHRGLLVVRHSRRVRSALLSNKTVALLGDYLLEHRGSLGPSGWLFPLVRDARRPARPDVVRDVVRRAAASMFPHVFQAAKRRRITSSGFGELYLRRLVRTRVAPDCFAALAGFNRLDRIRRYARPDVMVRARRELQRVAGRWSDWL